MADALDSKSGFSNEVWVQVPPPVPLVIQARCDDTPGFFLLIFPETGNKWDGLYKYSRSCF